MPMLQLVYASRPFGFDDLALAGILASARQNNSRRGITGALICREDLYLQMLEGEPNAVQSTFARIATDDRHANVVTLLASETSDRLFPTWAMRHDPARSWMWTADEVRAGAVVRATPDAVRGVFARLAAEAPSVAQTCPFNGGTTQPSRSA